MAKERADALPVLSDAMFLGERRRIVELAASGALPAMYSQSFPRSASSCGADEVIE
jgi:hypothetical protein